MEKDNGEGAQIGSGVGQLDRTQGWGTRQGWSEIITNLVFSVHIISYGIDPHFFSLKSWPACFVLAC